MGCGLESVGCGLLTVACSSRKSTSGTAPLREGCVVCLPAVMSASPEMAL